MSTLEQARARWLTTVDQNAETARLQFITAGYGQAIVYALKREEARDILSSTGGDPDPALYPVLAAEIGITAPSLLEVAEIVWAISDQWVAVASAIETLRLSAKATISAAMDEAAMQAAAQISWPPAA